MLSDSIFEALNSLFEDLKYYPELATRPVHKEHIIEGIYQLSLVLHRLDSLEGKVDKEQIRELSERRFLEACLGRNPWELSLKQSK